MLDLPMRLVPLLVLAIVFGSPAVAQDTPATSGVTVLRGSSAPPPPEPAAPPPPATTIIQRETIYQPVYADPFGYGYAGYGNGVVNPTRRATPPAAPAQPPVANGWPLVQGGRR